MKLRSSGLLGISLGDRTIACAEVSVAGGRRVARRLATFALPQGMSLEKPEALGEAFAAFLRERGFGASRAVVGLPAKWLIAMERDIPPAGPDEARDMLRLQAERLAVSESGELTFDYAGQPDPSGPNRLLLVGVLRQRLDQIERLLKAARLSSVAVTSSALALAKVAGGAADGNSPMLVLGRQGAEMVWRNAHGAPRMLRHVSVVAANGHGPVSVTPLGSELGRALTLTRGNGTPASREMILWDGVGLSADQVTELSTRSGLNVRPGDAMASLGLETAPDAVAGTDEHPGAAADADVFAPALALALAAGDRDRLPIDFKRSRLTPVKQRRFGKGTTWAAVAGVVLALGLGGLYYAVDKRQRELDVLEADLKEHVEPVKTAQAQVDRTNTARGFFETRPPVLDALLEISLLFRDDEKIWITNFVAKEDHKITLQGKADSDRTVRAFLKRVKENPKFADVKLGGSTVQEGTQNRSSEVLFSITLSYIVKE
jgi:Tfp pilus assembly protein PilN